jgi:hypothetical protein
MVGAIGTTLRDIARKNCALEVECRKCSHKAFVDSRLLLRSVAPECQLTALPLRCKICNQRTPIVRAVPPGWT